MTTLTIRHVPEEVRNTLAARAARSGRSLQEYMLREVTKLAAKPPLDQWVDEAGGLTAVHGGMRGSIADLLADRDADRR